MMNIDKTNVFYEFNGWGFYESSNNVLDLIVEISEAIPDVTFVSMGSLTHEYIVTRPDTKEQGVVDLVCV